MKADVEELTGTREIGPKIAAIIIAFFSDSDNLIIIDRLKSFGVRFSEEEINAPINEKLKGKSVLISGVFNRHTREEYKEIIEKNGGKNVTTLSGSTSFILAGENMGQQRKRIKME